MLTMCAQKSTRVTAADLVVHPHAYAAAKLGALPPRHVGKKYVDYPSAGFSDDDIVIEEGTIPHGGFIVGKSSGVSDFSTNTIEVPKSECEGMGASVVLAGNGGCVRESIQEDNGEGIVSPVKRDNAFDAPAIEVAEFDYGDDNARGYESGGSGNEDGNDGGWGRGSESGGSASPFSCSDDGGGY